MNISSSSLDLLDWLSLQEQDAITAQQVLDTQQVSSQTLGLQISSFLDNMSNQLNDLNSTPSGSADALPISTDSSSLNTVSHSSLSDQLSQLYSPPSLFNSTFNSSNPSMSSHLGDIQA